jgi:DNA-binding response OmpR family regulator
MNSASVRNPAIVSAPSRGATLLVVDDDADAADILGRLLRRAGFTVVVAHDIAEARARLAEGDIQGLVTDLDLPDGTGHLLLDGGRPQGLSAALVLSGFHRQDDKDRTLAAGFDAHLVKPVDPKALVALLDRLLVVRSARERSA